MSQMKRRFDEDPVNLGLLVALVGVYLAGLVMLIIGHRDAWAAVACGGVGALFVFLTT